MWDEQVGREGEETDSSYLHLAPLKRHLPFSHTSCPDMIMKWDIKKLAVNICIYRFFSLYNEFIVT